MARVASERGQLFSDYGRASVALGCGGVSACEDVACCMILIMRSNEKWSYEGGISSLRGISIYWITETPVMQFLVHDVLPPAVT